MLYVLMVLLTVCQPFSQPLPEAPMPPKCEQCLYKITSVLSFFFWCFCWRNKGEERALTKKMSKGRLYSKLQQVAARVEI